MYISMTWCSVVNDYPFQSQLSDVSPNEEFTTSLGVDQSIRITCQPVSTVHNTRGRLVGGKTNSITYSHVFVVKNTRSEEINIQVLEQVPLSTDDRIKVLDPTLLQSGWLLTAVNVFMNYR